MITSNWHQHSHHSVECHGNGRTINCLIAESEGLGFTDFGVTDHIHTEVNRPDLVAVSREFWSEERSPRHHLGVEVSVVSAWEIEEIASGRAGRPEYGIREGGPEGAPPALALEQADLDEFGIEYVVGGTHWPLYAPLEREPLIRDYHRQNMFLATHPLVSIVAHPWWWMGKWKDEDGGYRGDPWLDDFSKVPASMHDELAAAAIEHGKMLEVNGQAMINNRNYTDAFRRQYAEVLAGWKERGVTLSFATDDHGPAGRGVGADAMGEVERRLSDVGITDADLWRLPPRPGEGGTPS